MRSVAPAFYSFSGMHAFLMGLLPFYLPVLIWQRSESLTQLFTSIAVSGAVFAICLPLWRYFARRNHWSGLIITSFVLELSLISAIIFVPESRLDGVLLGLINGCYMCFYWMTLRSLFCAMTADSETGKSFGNFQILVMIALKIGMIAGALLIDTGLMHWLMLPSILMLLTCHRLVSGIETPLSQIASDFNAQPSTQLSLKEGIVFSVEGTFLYLESFAWVLSIYWLIGSEIVHLGATIVALGVAVALLFWLVRSVIDRGPTRAIFLAAVLLYALSWMMRGHISSYDQQSSIALGLLAIAFMTTLFRLSFNKAFFDEASKRMTGQYIFKKSQVSQLAIATCFGLLALSTIQHEYPAAVLLEQIYWAAAPLSLVFFWYAPATANQTAHQQEVTINRNPFWRTKNS